MPSFDLWDDAPASKAKLIIIDECSMVDAELGRDLMSFGVPLLVLGDPAQLPPIQGGGFFTEPSPTPCSPKCIARRRTIRSCGSRWRSAPASALAPGEYGETQVVRARRARPAARDRGRPGAGRPQRHAARLQRAACASAAASPAPLPVAGDKLVCLRNNRRKGLFNGGLWMVKETPRRGGRSCACTSRPTRICAQPRGVKVSVRPECFTGEHRGSSSGRSASDTTSSTSATCSPCTRRKARNGTTSCCSTRLRVSRQPRALALYRRHARGEAADHRGVSRMKRAPTNRRVLRGSTSRAGVGN